MLWFRNRTGMLSCHFWNAQMLARLAEMGLVCYLVARKKISNDKAILNGKMQMLHFKSFAMKQGHGCGLYAPACFYLLAFFSNPPHC